MKCFGRKGMVPSFLGLLIIALIGGMVVLSSVFVIITKLKPKTLETICYDSVVARSKFQIGVSVGPLTPALKPMMLLCRMVEKEVGGSKEEVLKEIADSLARCWWMFNEGKTNCVLESVQGREDCFFECFKCYDIFVDEIKLAKDEKIDIADLKYYLANEKYKKFNVIYTDYLSKLKLTTGELKPGNVYSIIFAEASDGSGLLFGDYADKISLSGGIGRVPLEVVEPTLEVVKTSIKYAPFA
ncbi:MAG: hypothetical protein HQ564_10720, partial [Candidatus Saganbacteria bacterium]|nr:hypothetical protein [Candidatus Saganbacteria bacterium]